MLASMKSDLRNLVTAEEGFFSDNQDYSGTLGPAQVNGVAGAGTVAFVPSANNVITVTRQSAGGWSATVTNATLKGAIQTCGIFVGSGVAPNGAVTAEGAPACY